MFLEWFNNRRRILIYRTVLCAETVNGLERFKDCPYGFVFYYLNTFHFFSPPLVLHEVVLLVQ